MRPVVLDVTRTLSPKSIATPTGIDRVERAYVEYFLNVAPEALFVCKIGRTYHLLDRDFMVEDFDRVLSGDQDAAKHIRKRKGGVWREIGQLLGIGASESIPHLSFPEQFCYLNVGHSNLSRPWLRALRKTGARRMVGFVHDMIPLDAPEYQTKASVAQFETRMRALAEQADLIFTNSEYTRSRVSHWFGEWGFHPDIVANPLGVETMHQGAPIRSERPYFVALGTIEPRKNHALLLKVWESFADLAEADRPILHIIGRRGWLNEAVFETLDTAPMMGRDVFEHGSLSDEEVAGYLRGAHALLFPSFTEGYGLPLLEAISVGTPTIVSDIPVFRELAGPLSLYLNPFDATVWRKAIINRLSSDLIYQTEDKTERHRSIDKAFPTKSEGYVLGTAQRQTKQGKPGKKSNDGASFKLPNWDDHFALLERHL